MILAYINRVQDLQQCFDLLDVKFTGVVHFKSDTLLAVLPLEKVELALN